ncbi:MAG: AraC family transcriptional regulator ligand-binding domain-containing protein [Bacteroidales bacterium]|nr:AraC family transcriptional regulator ligand-binding domain-containing protein [Bacteroidales bacterium]
MELDNISGAWVLEAFRRGGVDLDLLTQQLPDDVEMLLYNMYTIPPNNINRLLLACSEISDNQDFGLTMNERIDITMYGLIGYLMLNSCTVRDLCENLEKYYAIFYSAGPFFKFTINKNTISILFNTVQAEELSHRHQIEWSLGFIAYFLQSPLGELAKPSVALFSYNPPKNLDKLKSVFGCNLKFNQTENKLIYSKSLLNKQISNVDSGMLKVLHEEADLLLNNYLKKYSLLKKIKLLLVERIAGKHSNASDIAKELNFSLSTFKRNMHKENINFRETKDLIKNELAKKLLSKTTVNLNCIAKKTGFSDQSSFTRFFLRCNSMTPHEFREKND